MHCILARSEQGISRCPWKRRLDKRKCWAYRRHMQQGNKNIRLVYDILSIGRGTTHKRFDCTHNWLHYYSVSLYIYIYNLILLPSDHVALKTYHDKFARHFKMSR